MRVALKWCASVGLALTIGAALPVQAQTPGNLFDTFIGITQAIENQGNPQQPNTSPGGGVPTSGGASSSGDISRAELQAVQARLNALGYDAGPADGLMGQRTRDAIHAFQARMGEAETGRLTQAQMDRLFDPSAAETLAALPGASGGGDSAGNTFEILRGTDLPGNDFRMGIRSSSNPQAYDPSLANMSLSDCQDACFADGRCGAFTYNQSARICFLKSEAGGREPFSAAVSGILVAGGGGETDGEWDGDRWVDTINDVAARGEVPRIFLSGSYVNLPEDLQAKLMTSGDMQRLVRLFELGTAEGNFDQRPRYYAAVLEPREIAPYFNPQASAFDRYYQTGDINQFISGIDNAPWKGQHEFDTADSAAKFLEEKKQVAIDLVPDGPIRVSYFQNVQLDGYSPDGFPLRTDGWNNGGFNVSRAFEVEQSFRFHSHWRLAEEQARAFREWQIQEGVYSFVLRIDYQIDGIELVNGRAVARTSIDDLSLLRADDLDAVVAELSAEPLERSAAHDGTFQLGPDTRLVTADVPAARFTLAEPYAFTALTEIERLLRMYELQARPEQFEAAPRYFGAVLEPSATAPFVQSDNFYFENFFEDGEINWYVNGLHERPWAGFDEFEQADNRAAFLEQLRTDVFAHVPNGEVSVSYFQPVSFERYEAGGFPLEISGWENGGLLHEMRRFSAVSIPQPVQFPETWPMTEAEARAFRQTQRETGRQLLLRTDFTITGVAAEGQGIALDVRGDRLAIVDAASPDEAVHEFAVMVPVPPPAPPPPDGSYKIDASLPVVIANYSFGRADALAQQAASPQDIIRLSRLLELRANPALLDRNPSRYAAVLDPSDVRTYFADDRRAFADFFDDGDLEDYVDWLDNTSWAGRDEFERGDSRAKFLADKKDIILAMVPEGEVVIRHFQPVTMEIYTDGAFPLHFQGWQGGGLTADSALRIAPGFTYPDRWAVDETGGRAFRAAQRNLGNDQAIFTEYRIVGARASDDGPALDTELTTVAVVYSSAPDEIVAELPVEAMAEEAPEAETAEEETAD